jgi:hypothetical protein
MRSLILTVHFVAAGVCLDLEVPAGVPVRELLDLLRQALPGDWSPAEHIAAHPPGRELDPQETLGDAGVLDGAWLVVGSDR